MPRTRDAMKFLRASAEEDPALMKALQKARLNARVAQAIYDMRTQANLTQQQLADKIGTRQPVLARLEDADYEGHSLTMLQRVASTLGFEVDISYRPAEPVQSTATGRMMVGMAANTMSWVSIVLRMNTSSSSLLMALM